ncbi:6,7-dimethyl-8-ribityllumazine synthase [Rubripirellula obstinata]|uniref:6,7-dimethyl-8-ribityllumazine synthase n=1 Tax=Rubripirellula obstinata TaxID=406547 RepID=A0A5B1CCV5_9BACT|nr:6,7-dimethyl-8-ribityllumazine synthase [Rubripirellula obstinata]KAA1258998.1 6,7-dimethyl-8-ribityllumazine synthase [Rubripirellula obstinata]
MTTENNQGEISGIDGTLPAGKIVIVASRYNPAICDSLVSGSLETLSAAGYASAQTPVIRVPGAWELPSIVDRCLQNADAIAAIALGCVIRGETTHDEHINRSVSLSLMEMGVRTGRPIAFGLLTCNTLEQAIQRSGGTVGNKGNESAEAILELLRLEAKLNECLPA